MTKAQRAERTEAIERLREWVKPGDTVYTVLRHISRSGMQREIGVLVPRSGEPGQPADFLHPNHAVATAIGSRLGKRDGVIMGGCGMDMGVALVYELSYALYGAGYACLGKGKCPSCYHVNHRDRIRCEGAGDRRCWIPDFWSGRHAVPADWPYGPTQLVDSTEGPIEVPGPALACLMTDHDGAPYEICPTCQGAYWLPNPEGPERWDLTHRDGYALRHRWI
jgi:hypothetical protein